MMNVNVVAVGRIRERYIRDGIDEYVKRLRPYCRLNIMEVTEQQAPQDLSKADMESVKIKEGRAILEHIKGNEYIIALAIEGAMMSSERLAGYISDLMISGHSSITFIIGGSLGLSSEVLARADMLLSFSPMTFPHQLMRLILLEQLYRCFKINSGEPYHK
ncbi:MAG: rRNA (pseudouridine1915-N3)-methyltransferase [Clostridiales bacterium]|nr:rRNA (pseudouridine1915-N3)-methyltransferase [Clostridiales bacterium]